MRRITILLLLLCFLALPSFAKGGGGHGGGKSSSKGTKAPRAKKVKAPKTAKPVHVRGYSRKDGTYVTPHDRALPGTADTSTSIAAPSTHSYRRNYIASGIGPHSSVRLDKHGKIKRSPAAKAAFVREHPCPATGKTSGKCPGYVVDHVNPLECGGADDKSNMQWQTAADAKAKDKMEGHCGI